MVLVIVCDVSDDAVRVGCVSHFGSTHRCFGAGPNIRSPGDLSGRIFSQDLFSWSVFFRTTLVFVRRSGFFEFLVFFRKFSKFSSWAESFWAMLFL